MRLAEYNITGTRSGPLTGREERVWKALSAKSMKTAAELAVETGMPSNDASDNVRMLCQRKMAKCLVKMQGIGSHARPRMPYYYMKTRIEEEGNKEDDNLHEPLRDARPPAPILQAQ